ncbi:hypothetical protein Taro_016893 [Colocasia esculenta]|uniref:Secreted protein n=1 Tax=Colocasia esculenta TaxID=4460 RepID=A0A843UPT1_COLES|nr:hypothetical protein [Colocasia esculenta]
MSLLVDGPLGGFQEVCSACLCLLGLSWLQVSCAFACGGCPAYSQFARCLRFHRYLDPQSPCPLKEFSMRQASLSSDSGSRGENGGGQRHRVDTKVVWLFFRRRSPNPFSLPLSAFVPEPSRGVRHGAAARPGYGGLCVCVLYAGSLASLYWGGCRQESVVGELEEWPVRVEGCFRIVYDSDVSAGDASSPTLVVGRGVTVFRCFITLCSRDSLSQEFVAGRLWWQLVPPCIASSVSCERESSCTLFEFIAYLTGLNANPSRSSDPWVAARPSGSLAGVREVASFLARSEYELQESVAAAAAGYICYECAFGLDCCVQSACLPLVKMRDLDYVCGPVFGRFTMLFASKSLGCAGGTACVPVV